MFLCRLIETLCHKSYWGLGQRHGLNQESQTCLINNLAYFLCPLMYGRPALYSMQIPSGSMTPVCPTIANEYSEVRQYSLSLSLSRKR